VKFYQPSRPEDFGVKSITSVHEIVMMFLLSPTAVVTKKDPAKYLGMEGRTAIFVPEEYVRMKPLTCVNVRG